MAKRTVDVWVGLFKSEKRCDRYLREYYGDDGETLLPEFSFDTHTWSYNHDFFESSFHPKSTDDMNLLLQDHSYTEVFGVEAKIAFETCKCPVNAVFLVWNEAGDFEQIKQPKSISKLGIELIYVGRFDS